MFEAYKVAIKLTLINDLSKGLLLASDQFKILNTSAEAFQNKLRQIKAMAMAGGALLGAGFAIAAPLIYATSKAAELQKQMIGIQIATVGTTRQMDSMRKTIEGASTNTMFSAVDVAKMGKIIGTSNTFTAPQLQSVLPEYAKFADVQLLLKGTNYEESVKEAVRLAHTAKIYDPAGLAKYLDVLTKASVMSSGSITELGTALKYSQGTAQTALGVSPETMVMITALANRLGFAGSRGGTNLIDAMIRTMPGIFGSGLLEGKSNQALLHMGLIDKKGHSRVFSNGKFDVEKWMKGLDDYVSSEFSHNPEAIARQKILTNMQHAFGAQGRRIATLFADPQALQQFRIMEGQYHKLANTSDIQETYVKGSVSQQWKTALTNFQNVMIDLGTMILPTATKWLNSFNSDMRSLMDWISKHKEVTKEFVGLIIKLSIAFAVAGTVMLFVAAMAAIANPVGLAISAISLIILNFDKLKKPFDWFIGEIDKLATFLGDDKKSSESKNTILYNPKNPNNNVEHHSHIFLDGKQIAHVVTKHQANEASRQPAHGSSFNGSMFLQPNMLNAAG